ETFAQRVEQKKELIAEAKRCLANSTFTEDEVNAVKAIRTKWREVGNAGRENEEKLYAEFNEIMNLYFQNMRDYRNN
ncbi:MAG: DUF349 domain-containing protein, partial [Erysipelotrichaceae bacterium]|nr:DUF349 domain-containing protein [Erysipelotrichaceae bacterium]